MNQREACDVLGAAFQTLAKEGYIVEGTMTFLKPVVPGLINNDVTFQCGKVGVVTGSISASKSDNKENITGEICVTCGGCRFQQTGTCKTCLDCGSNAGCG